MQTVICVALVAIFPFLLAQKNSNMWHDRSTIVELFEWKFSDIADECERFLQHKGYGGVQVSPVSENIIIKDRPWWERYQPISYNIISRSGDENEFLDMTRRCNAVGVRVYVDVVFNHMTEQVDNAVGVGGSKANARDKNYPAVPYTPNDFHSACSINDYYNVDEVRNCYINDTLNDLNQSQEHVRETIAQYLNKLISLGAGGFRVDSATHMSPKDLAEIYSRLNYLNVTFGFNYGTKPYIYYHVVDIARGGVLSSQYSHLGLVTEFKYSARIGSVFRGWDKLRYLDGWGPSWGFLAHSEDALVFVDDHETQRGHGAGPFTVLNYKTPKQYKMATAFMLANDYGSPKVMSSYDFSDVGAGPPADKQGNIISPSINPDGTCSNGWICEQRWRQIYGMVGFRNAVQGTEMNNYWANIDHKMAFCRGNKGFIVFTNGGHINEHLHTSLEPGIYCDVISGELIKNSCTGKSLTIESTGYAHVMLRDDENDGVLAFHVNARLN